MTGTVAGVVLFAAVLHAGWNALLRMSGDRLVVIGLLNTCAGLIALGLAPLAPLPAAPSLPYMALSGALHLGYNLFLVAAYRHGGLSQVYPIARGSAPLLVLLGAWIFLGERIDGLGVVAVIVTSLGIAALSLHGEKAARLPMQGLLFALGTAAFIAAYTVTDAAGARVAGSPHAYTLWLFALDGAVCLLVVGWWRGRAFFAAARHAWPKALLGGLMSLAAYGLVIWALTLAPAAPVSALRETSVLIAALLGTLLLKEPFGPWRVAAAGVVAFGTVLLGL